MDLKQLVLQSLKPKVSAFGFDKKELESVAAKIAGNLNLAEEASEEETQAAIDQAVEVAVPFLAISQQAVTRIVNAKAAKSKEEPEDKPKDEPDDKKKNPQEQPDDMPAWAKALVEQQKQQTEALKAEISAMKAEKATTSRNARLKEVLKDTGTFGKTTLRQFEHMNFKDDDEFEEFLTGVQEDLESLNQERTEAGLGAFGNPPSAGGKKETKDPEVYSDTDLQKIAAVGHSNK